MEIGDLVAERRNAIAMGPFGSRIKVENFVPDGVPVIRGTNLVGRHLREEGYVFITEEKADELRASQVGSGDLVFTHRGTIGQVGMIPRDSQFARYIVSQSQMKLSLDETKALPEFLYHVFRSPRGQRLLLANASSTGVPAIAAASTSLRRIRIPLPPLWEQVGIAAMLDAVDDMIERTEAVIAATEELRRSLLHELLTRGVPGWHSEWKQIAGLGAVPACWDITTLGEVGKWMSGGTPSKQREDYWNGAIPWISAKDMKVHEIWDATDHITKEAARQGSRIVGPGTILVVVRGMILAHSFPIAITRADCAFNQDLRALVCRDGVAPEFVVAAMESRRRRLLDLPTTSTHGTKRIITEELQSVQIPLPPTAEQEHIARAVDALYATSVEGASTVAQLRQSKAALADALLTGDLRVPLRSVK